MSNDSEPNDSDTGVPVDHWHAPNLILFYFILFMGAEFVGGEKVTLGST
jgi:hypothetical protein